MERISKSHDSFKLMKEMIKTNHYPNITVTDDTEILKLAYKNNLKIKLLFYCFELDYKDETKELLNNLIVFSRILIISSLFLQFETFNV